MPIFSVKLVDGFTKSLCVQAIFGLVHYMVTCLTLINLLHVRLCAGDVNFLMSCAHFLISECSCEKNNELRVSVPMKSVGMQSLQPALHHASI